MSDEWKTNDGEIVSMQDCVEALHVANSLFVKELEHNKNISMNPTKKTLYIKYKEILSIIRYKFEEGARNATKGKRKKR